MSKNIKTFVSDLNPVTQQIGNHIMSALSEPKTAAVLTSLVPGFPQDRIASVPVTREQLMKIHALLASDQVLALEPKKREGEERNIGFHIDLPDGSSNDQGDAE